MSSEATNSMIRRSARVALALTIVILFVSLFLSSFASAQDTIPPVTTLTTTPVSPDGTNGWSKTTPTVTLTRNEPGTTYYSWVSSTGPWTTYSAPFSAPEGQNTLYYYSVDTAGNTEAVKSQLFKVDTGLPSAPVLSGVAVSSYQIDLSWAPSTDAVSGVAGYKIFDAVTNLEIATTGTTSYSHRGLNPNTTHNYYVKAFDMAGNLSPASNTLSVTTPVKPVNS